MPEPEVPRLAAARVLPALAAALIVVGAVGAGAQERGVDFAVEPVPGSQTPPRGGYFLIQANPGDRVMQAVGLRNDSDQRLELRLAAVDAVTGSLGGASYGLPDERPTRTGAWIALEPKVVSLDAKASAVVRFDVQVPSDALSGVHLAGISVAPPASAGESGQAGAGEAGASIDVQTRRVVAVQVNLPGPSDPELVIGGVSPAARPDGLYLGIAIENRGRGLTTGEGTVTLPDDGFEREFSIDTFVPATSIAYPVKWTTDVEEGEHRARVEIRYGDKTATWAGTFEVGEKVRQEQAERQVQPAAGTADGGGGGGLPPVAIGAAAAGAIALVGGGSLMFRRFRRPVGRHAFRR